MLTTDAILLSGRKEERIPGLGHAPAFAKPGVFSSVSRRSPSSQEMAWVAGIESAPTTTTAFSANHRHHGPLHSSLRQRCSVHLQHRSKHIILKPLCSIGCSRHGLSDLERCVISLVPSRGRHTVAAAAHCSYSSSAASCPSRSLDHMVIPCTSKYLPRRAITITVSATADSDQTFPSQDEDGERAVGCYRGNERVIPKKPSPEIEPGDVVQAQLRALHERDLMTVFEFASPKNKAHMGPLSRFAEMIQGRAYNVMLGHASAEVLSTIFISPGRFQQRVVIKGANGKQAVFSWSLSRQETDPFQGCWMTDSVHRDE